MNYGLKRHTLPAIVLRAGALDMKVCAPMDWMDGEIVTFANMENPCGTSAGWKIRKKGDKALGGDNERVPCASNPHYVHIMLDA